MSKLPLRLIYSINTLFVTLVLILLAMSSSSVISLTPPRKSLLAVSLVVLLMCVFTIIAVAHFMHLGSAAFFIVVIASAVVLLAFFCGLLAYSRARLQAGGLDDMPVFYYLETARRSDPVRPVDDFEFWASSTTSLNGQISSCPICLCDVDPIEQATGQSKCCSKELHIACAQKYFNAIQKIQCPLCRFPESGTKILEVV